MLFRDKLDKKRDLIHPEFERLFKAGLENQKHPNDLLIVVLNGFYTPNETFKMTSGEMSSPYVIGPGKEGHSENLHYKFIDAYRQNHIYGKSFEKYKEEIKYSAEKRIQIDKSVYEESLTIQLEMLIYLKVWEMTQFLKNLYQFVRILKGEHYDWDFKLKTGNDNEGTATAQELIRLKIRDEIKPFSEKLYNEFKLAYKSQIRNSIAHSNYSFIGRNIHPNNKNPEAKFSQIGNLPFDDWIDMFHSTMMLYNSYIWLKKNINQHFGDLASKSNNILEIRINKIDESEVFSHVEFRPKFLDWRWAR